MNDELGEIEKVLDSMSGQVLPVGHTVRSSITLGVAPADLSSIHRCAKSLDDENDRLRAQVGRLQHAIHIHNRDHLRVTLQLDDMGKLPPLDIPPIAEERNGLLFGDLAPLEDE